MTDGRLGVLLLSGVRHQASYVPLFNAHPRLRVVALADEPGLPGWMDAANVALAGSLGIPYLRDVDAALDRADVDVVSVCSEPTRHARLAARAAAAGKHVLVDKPMALTSDECDTLEAAARSGGGRGKLTFVHRLFSPAVQRLRALVDAGTFGLPWAMHVTWLSAGGLGGGTVEHDALVVDPALSGGGELANFLLYPVGSLRFVTGLEIESVYATTASHVHEQHRRTGVEDFGVLMLTLQNAVLATATVGRLADDSAPGPGILTLRLHGSHASAMLDEHRPRVEVYRAGGRGGVVERYGDGGAGTQALRGLLADFVSAIDEDRPPLCGVADARAFVAVLEAAYASAAGGGVVPVDSPRAPARAGAAGGTAWR